MRYIVDILYDSIVQFSKDDGWAIASHIALSILTSMFPFLIFVTALGGFFGTKEIADEAVRILFQTWPEQVVAPLANEIQNILTRGRGGILTFGIVLSIYFSSSGVEALRIGLNRAYDVIEKRSWWWLRLESIVYVLIGAFALLTLALLIILAPLIWRIAVSFAPGLDTLGRLITLSRFAIATLVLLMALIIVHKFLPAGQRTLPDVLIGVLLTVCLWIAFGGAFGAYLAEFSRNYVSTYAGLASVMVALVFLYTTAAIFILGGELNAAILRAKSKSQPVNQRMPKRRSQSATR